MVLTRIFGQTSSQPLKHGETVSNEPNSTHVDVVVSTTVEKLEQVALDTTDIEQLRRLAVDGPTTQVRQSAAEAIHDPEVLKRLLRELRGKDKNAYRIVRQKCDALNQEERSAAERQTNAAALCEAIERHSYKPFDGIYEATLDHFMSQWQPLLDAADADVQERCSVALARCRDVIAKHDRRLAEEAAAATAVAEADSNRLKIAHELRYVLAKVYDADSIATVRECAQASAACMESWRATLQYKAANAETKSTFDRLSSAIHDAIKHVESHGTVRQQAEAFRNGELDTDLAPQFRALKGTLQDTSLLDEVVSQSANDAQAALQVWEQRRADKAEATATTLRQVGSLVRKLSGVLAQGKTAQAAGLRRAVEDKLPHLQSVPEHIANQLQQLDVKLNELRDWRSYAVAPKREQLIEQMEALAKSTEHPNRLAEQIKRLQDEWKTISKGVGNNDKDQIEADWQRFHQAAQTAFAPCREFFEAQAQQRQANLEKRKTLLARLAAFVGAQNWEQPNWKEVAKALREARQQWHAHQPVERAANKPLQEEFDAMLGGLQTRFDSECAKNSDEKRRLIARAQRLLTSEDARKAIDDVKRLQQQWKDIGPVAREEDQKLWQEFRQHCDAVFAKRQQQHDEFVAALEDNKRRAIALCEEAEQLHTLAGDELLQAGKKLPTLREAFEAIGELPKSSAKELRARFDKAVEKYDRQVARQRADDKTQAWNNLLAAADRVRLHRLAIAENASAEEQAARRQDANEFIDGIQHWPKGGLPALKQELARRGDLNGVANETALRTICIRAEILTDSETPTSDQALRREYQLQRLVKGMGRESPNDSIETLIFEWIAVGAVTTDVYMDLLARLERCRAKAQHVRPR